MIYEDRQHDHAQDDYDDGLWERPAWAKGGVKLKSTGKAEVMKKNGNLAAPITFTPFKNQDHTNKLASPRKLSNTKLGSAAKEGIDLAAPITFTPFKSDDHTNYVANPSKLRTTDLGAKMKADGDLANPITNIREAPKKKIVKSK